LASAPAGKERLPWETVPTNSSTLKAFGAGARPPARHHRAKICNRVVVVKSRFEIELHAHLSHHSRSGVHPENIL